MSTILDLVTRTGTPLQPSTVKPITCTLEVVTPMFLAGADPKVQNLEDLKREGLRAASVKGMLRSWWRLAQSGSVSDLLKEERRLWGLAATDSTDPPPRGPTVRTHEIKNSSGAMPRSLGPISAGPGSATYYLGYGAVRNQNKPDENPGKCQWGEGSAFELSFQIRDSEQRQAILHALKLWHAFGGLGSRSRRTWGSVALSGPDMLPAAVDIATLSEQVHCLVPLGHPPQDRPSIIGARLQVAPRIFTSPSEIREKVFELFKGAGKDFGIRKGCWAFGLPWQGKKSQPPPPTLPKGMNRRASPLLLKIHRLGTNRYALIALKTNGPFHPHANPGREQLARLDEFLDRIALWKNP